MPQLVIHSGLDNLTEQTKEGWQSVHRETQNAGLLTISFFNDNVCKIFQKSTKQVVKQHFLPFYIQV